MTPQQMQERSLRQRFEAYWKRTHVEKMKRNAVRRTDWLARDDIWGRGGYAQPCVHFDWLNYRAGFKAGLAQKAINDRKGKV